MLFYQKTLGFLLKINAPFLNEILKLFLLVRIGIFQDIDGLRIREPLEIILRHKAKTVQQA